MNSKELKERFIDEKTGIEYGLVGDYYLPNIVLPKPIRTGKVWLASGCYGYSTINPPY